MNYAQKELHAAVSRVQLAEALCAKLADLLETDITGITIHGPAGDATLKPSEGEAQRLTLAVEEVAVAQLYTAYERQLAAARELALVAKQEREDMDARHRQYDQAQKGGQAQ